MKIVLIPFTEQEANAALALLDAAVRAGGLQVAPTALSLAQKLQAAFNEPEPGEEAEKEEVEESKQEHKKAALKSVS